jgi:hypothetical protein
METKIIVGCNYHTTWQSNKAMRFVLAEDLGETVVLKTRTTNKRFTCKKSDLIWIDTHCNNNKAHRILKSQEI